MLLLDTHIWVWWLLGQKDLPPKQRTRLNAAASRNPPLVSDISVWEVQMMFAKGRLPLQIPFDQWLHRATRPDLVQMVRIDVAVALRLNGLPVDFQGDPADRIIVATALARGVPLFTHDRKMQRCMIVPLWS